MSRASMTRRGLLQALTVGAGSLAFGGGRLGELIPRAQAAGNPGPKRLIIFPIANGVIEHSDIGTPGATPSTFKLGYMAEPLEAHRNDLVMLNNIEMHREVHLDTHYGGFIQMLTGTQPRGADDYDNTSSHESLDQYAGPIVSKGLNWPSLYLGTACDVRCYSYRKDGTGLQADSDPLNVYKNVFGNLNTSSSGPDPALLRRLARRQSVLDSVAKDVTSFIKRLPEEDKARADAQLTAIRDMELRLGGQMKGNTSCSKPNIAQADYRAENFNNFPETMRAIFDLTVAAMACDQTRLVLMHGHLGASYAYHCSWDPVNVPGHSLHSLSHNLEGSANFSAYKTAKRFMYTLAAELATKLKNIPEPTVPGASMLDHTLIVLGSEVGAGHTPMGLQFQTIGGKGLGVKTGQWLQYGTDTFTAGAGMSHQRLLVSMLNAIGIADTTFGEMAGTGSGPLPGFFA